MYEKNNVMKNYEDSGNLDKRVSLHEKYSVNQYGWSNWVYDNYHFWDGCKILELGCGNAYMWEKKIKELSNQCKLYLSDFSQGMVDYVSQKFQEYENVTVLKIDIQDIIFEDSSFDFVIANHMLYHVQDIRKALYEVRRVLRPGGEFYCTTNGERGYGAFDKIIHGYGLEGSYYLKFNLQNGQTYLNNFFDDIRMIEYEDSFEISNEKDLAAYIYSAKELIDIPKDFDIDNFTEYLCSLKDKEGFIRIPKESGMFIAK